VKDALTDIKGNAYLPARQRVRWMREEHKADWSVLTSIVDMDFVKGYAIVRAEVTDKDGRVIASAFKTGTRQAFHDFLEKAETGAIGRALALCGYGTEDALDLDEEGAIADAPVQKNASPAPSGAPAPKAAKAPRSAPQPAPSPAPTGEPDQDDAIWEATMDALASSKPAHPKPLPPLEEASCPEHGTDRIRQAKQGHHYCATKLPDGSWCDWSDRR
jgi:hypothetical protein